MSEIFFGQHLQRVSSFDELLKHPFTGQVNALCWQRQPEGDFAELVTRLQSGDNMRVISREELETLPLSAQGQAARQTIVNDLQVLSAHGAQPVLNLIRHYERDTAFPQFPTDVYSFHVDRAPLPTSTFLCTYYGAPSELLPNEQARQKILNTELRAALKHLYKGPEEGFENFLREHFFDLHYEALPGAQVVNSGRGNLWRLAVDHPESLVPPCIHRAPPENKDEPRLMLIC